MVTQVVCGEIVVDLFVQTLDVEVLDVLFLAAIEAVHCCLLDVDYASSISMLHSL